MSSKRQKIIPLGGRYRQVILYLCCIRCGVMNLYMIMHQLNGSHASYIPRWQHWFEHSVQKSSPKLGWWWLHRDQRHFKSPASRLFVGSFVQARVKQNIKAPLRWPLCGESTDGWCDSPHKSILLVKWSTSPSGHYSDLYAFAKFLKFNHSANLHTFEQAQTPFGKRLFSSWTTNRG